jgi:hypothetical protein
LQSFKSVMHRGAPGRISESGARTAGQRGGRKPSRERIRDLSCRSRHVHA